MSLFHYTRLDTFANHILPSGTLMTNSLMGMNDPRESHRSSFGSINLPLEKLFPGYYSDKTHNDCLFKFGDMVKQRLQVICFSGANHRGWDNEMMWAHYADRQRGVCLEFDEARLLASIEHHFHGLRHELRPVGYESVGHRSKREDKPWINWNELLSPDENFAEFLEVLSQQVVFHKSHFWEKEDEKRLLFLNRPERLVIPYADSLKAVHLGIGAPYPMDEEIFHSIKEKGVKVYVMIYQDDRYDRWVLTRKGQKWWTSSDDADNPD